jgi:hypothetical protein
LVFTHAAQQANKERFACLPGDEIKTRMIAGSFFCGLVVAVQSKCEFHRAIYMTIAGYTLL